MIDKKLPYLVLTNYHQEGWGLEQCATFQGAVEYMLAMRSSGHSEVIIARLIDYGIVEKVVSEEEVKEKRGSNVGSGMNIG